MFNCEEYRKKEIERVNAHKVKKTTTAISKRNTGRQQENGGKIRKLLLKVI